MNKVYEQARRKPEKYQEKQRTTIVIGKELRKEKRNWDSRSNDETPLLPFLSPSISLTHALSPMFFSPEMKSTAMRLHPFLCCVAVTDTRSLSVLSLLFLLILLLIFIILLITSILLLLTGDKQHSDDDPTVPLLCGRDVPCVHSSLQERETNSEDRTNTHLRSKNRPGRTMKRRKKAGKGSRENDKLYPLQPLSVEQIAKTEGTHIY